MRVRFILTGILLAAFAIVVVCASPAHAQGPFPEAKVYKGIPYRSLAPKPAHTHQIETMVVMRTDKVDGGKIWRVTYKIYSADTQQLTVIMVKDAEGNINAFFPNQIVYVGYEGLSRSTLEGLFPERYSRKPFSLIP